MASKFGAPTLSAANNGSAQWVKGEVSPLDQKSATGWLAELTGGVQSGDDWARVNVPVNELYLKDLKAAQWSYYMTNTETMGVNMVVWVHDDKDFDKRAELTQAPNIATLEKASGWNAHELDTSVSQFFFYGENTTGTALTAGTQYTLAQFQADALFTDWTIYRITFEYGWEASGTFESAYVADIKINGQIIFMRPEFEPRYSEWKTATIADEGTVSAAVDLGDNYDSLNIVIPTIDSANISLQVSKDNSTFQALGLSTNVFAAGTGAITTTFNLYGWRYIKVVSSATQSTAAVSFLVRGYNGGR